MGENENFIETEFTVLLSMFYYRRVYGPRPMWELTATLAHMLETFRNRTSVYEDKGVFVPK